MTAAEVQQEVTRELTPNERLLWSGAPRQGLMFRPYDAVLIPFSIVWASFAVFWEWTAIGHPNAIILALWGIPFVLIGAYMVVGRFFTDVWVRKRTAYGVTNQRVIIISASPRRTVRTIPLRAIPEMSLSERADGSGTITFGPSGAGGTRRTPAPPQLEGIQQVRSVYQILLASQPQNPKE